jgi:tetraacyldisaccharide 4'-kinase
LRFDVSSYHRLIRGEARGVGPSLARGVLGVAGAGYGIGVTLRNRAFDRGGKAIEKAAVPVISVGNLTLGGTGKTPMVEWVARWGRERGVRVAILSRGYGQAEGLNDEGRVLEDNLPDVPHLQNPDRVALARIAVEELEAEWLVLDDGFQHRRLARDLDIVLLDALDPFGLGRLFPRGLLREPVSSLKRAGVVVLSRADLVDAPTRAAIRAEAERQAGPLRWAEARHAPRDLIDAEGRSRCLDRLEKEKAVAFCGLGNPEGFRRTLAGLGVEVAGFRAFPDHHPYSAADVAELADWSRTLGAGLALTTQKDSVKLRTPGLGPVPLLALRIGLEFLDGAEVLDEALSALLPARDGTESD